MTPFQEEVYRIVSLVPKGQIVSYGEVAVLADRPRAARAVGNALRRLESDSGVPWWRVVNGTGVVSTSPIDHTAQVQRMLLEAEGVEFSPSGEIDWDRFGWDGAYDTID